MTLTPVWQLYQALSHFWESCSIKYQVSGWVLVSKFAYFRFPTIVSSILCALSILIVPAAKAQDASDIDSLIVGAIQGKETGLPLPRFVSLKAKRTNMRVGPSFDHRISWVFVKPGVPVEVIQEFEVWRLIRDSEFQEGWVHKALLSSNRVAIVAPWSKDAYVDMHKAPLRNAAKTAKLQSGVYAEIVNCEDSWCQLEGVNYAGWVPAEQLYGVYPGEKVK